MNEPVEEEPTPVDNPKEELAPEETSVVDTTDKSLDEIPLPKKVQIIWKPKEDITAYELAQCVPVFVRANAETIEQMFDGVTTNAKRHWEITEVPDA